MRAFGDGVGDVARWVWGATGVSSAARTMGASVTPAVSGPGVWGAARAAYWGAAGSGGRTNKRVGGEGGGGKAQRCKNRHSRAPHEPCQKPGRPIPHVGASP